MREFLRRLGLPLLLASLVLLTLFSMVADRRVLAGLGRDRSFGAVLLELVVPVQKALLFPVEATRDVWSRYVALVGLRTENERLRARLAEVEEQNLQYAEAIVASGHLQRIAEMRETFGVPLQPAEVVGHDVSPWFRSILVDRGRSYEVSSGMPVVTDSGLVGLVTAASSHAARVMLLLDRQSAVDGMIQRSRARGIVRGTGSGLLEFTFMVRGDDVQPGDEVITSGVGGVHPKGLRVGRIAEVHADASSLLHTATVQPAADFGRLEQVFVMLHRGPTMDLLYAGEGDLPEPSAQVGEAPARTGQARP
jgi:rod shape-determining protein MreC